MRPGKSLKKQLTMNWDSTRRKRRRRIRRYWVTDSTVHCFCTFWHMECRKLNKSTDAYLKDTLILSLPSLSIIHPSKDIGNWKLYQILTRTQRNSILNALLFGMKCWVIHLAWQKLLEFNLSCMNQNIQGAECSHRLYLQYLQIQNSTDVIKQVKG